MERGSFCRCGNISAMKRIALLSASVISVLVILSAASFGEDEAKKIPAMPAAVSGNAVASVKGGLEIFSMMGVGPRKTWDDVTNQVYVLDLGHPKWREGPTVPGTAGAGRASPRSPSAIR